MRRSSFNCRRYPSCLCKWNIPKAASAAQYTSLRGMASAFHNRGCKEGTYREGTCKSPVQHCTSRALTAAPRKVCIPAAGSLRTSTSSSHASSTSRSKTRRRFWTGRKGCNGTLSVPRGACGPFRARTTCCTASIPPLRWHRPSEAVVTPMGQILCCPTHACKFCIVFVRRVRTFRCVLLHRLHVKCTSHGGRDYNAVSMPAACRGRNLFLV